MIDDLFKMIQESGRQTVVENQEVPNQYNEGVMQEAHSAIVSGLSGANTSGELNSLASSVQGGQANSNPAVQRISDNFTGNIMQKFGISGSTASSIASALIPMVLSKVIGRGQPGGNGFDLGSLISSVTNGGSSGTGSGGIGGLGNKLGLDKDGDGDVDLGDLSKMFKR